jgi:hypothetical protein
MDTPSVTLPIGDEMPVVGMGTWDVTGDAVKDSVGTALEAGYTHIDTAEGHMNESEIGDAIDRPDGIWTLSNGVVCDLWGDVSLLRSRGKIGALVALPEQKLKINLRPWASRAKAGFFQAPPQSRAVSCSGRRSCCGEGSGCVPSSVSGSWSRGGTPHPAAARAAYLCLR